MNKTIILLFLLLFGGFVSGVQVSYLGTIPQNTFLGLSRTQLINSMNITSQGFEIIDDKIVFYHYLNRIEPKGINMTIVQKIIRTSLDKTVVKKCLAKYTQGICRKNLVNKYKTLILSDTVGNQTVNISVIPILSQVRTKAKAELNYMLDLQTEMLLAEEEEVMSFSQGLSVDSVLIE